MVAQHTQLPVRNVVHRTRGLTGGPITRLMSPSDLGHLLKPFVFLDLAVFEDGEERTPMEYLWHPHSGIATVPVILEGAIRFAETTGRSGVLPAGGIEWMRAGNGVWHTGQAEPGRVRAFQLWVALPPELENGANRSQYLMPDEVPVVGPARVVLGSYRGQTSPIDSPPMTYLSVGLEPGQHWTYRPAEDHDVAWLAVHEGEVHTTTSTIPAGEIAVFEPSAQPIELVAQGKTGFVLGSARKHPHDLVLGSYSVHTSREALRKGQEEIRRIGRQLRDDGALRFARPIA
jgi:redox-sensitive bicupin YhaK (pirin superfamily)